MHTSYAQGDTKGQIMEISQLDQAAQKQNNIFVLVIRVCENIPLKVLLDKYLHPTESDPVIRHR